MNYETISADEFGRSLSGVGVDALTPLENPQLVPPPKTFKRSEEMIAFSRSWDRFGRLRLS